MLLMKKMKYMDKLRKKKNTNTGGKKNQREHCKQPEKKKCGIPGSLLRQYDDVMNNEPMKPQDSGRSTAPERRASTRSTSVTKKRLTEHIPFPLVQCDPDAPSMK